MHRCHPHLDINLVRTKLNPLHWHASPATEHVNMPPPLKWHPLPFSTRRTGAAQAANDLAFVAKHLVSPSGLIDGGNRRWWHQWQVDWEKGATSENKRQDALRNHRQNEGRLRYLTHEPGGTSMTAIAAQKSNQNPSILFRWSTLFVSAERVSWEENVLALTFAAGN